MIEVRVAGSAMYPELNKAIADFVSERLWGRPGRFDKYSTLGAFLDGKLVGGIVYHNWSPEAAAIEISGAAIDRRWLSREVLRTMFDIPFRRFGCQLVVMRVSEFNAPTIAMLERFGFAGHRVARLRGRGEGEIIFTLTDDQWRQHRLLGERNGQVLTSPAA